MDETQLMEFIKWIPTRIKELQNRSPEEVVVTLNKLSKTPEGQKQLEVLIQEFRSENSAMQPEETGMFKKGGKLDYLVTKFKDGGQSNSTSKSSDELKKYKFRSDSTYHALPKGPIYTRDTFYPFSTDTIVSKDGKFYTNSLGRSIRKFITGTSSFDQINRAIDSIAGYSTPRYDEGGHVSSTRQFSLSDFLRKEGKLNLK